MKGNSGWWDDRLRALARRHRLELSSTEDAPTKRDVKRGLALLGGTILVSFWLVDTDWNRRAASDRAQAGRGQYR